MGDDRTGSFHCSNQGLQTSSAAKIVFRMKPPFWDLEQTYFLPLEKPEEILWKPSRRVCSVVKMKTLEAPKSGPESPGNSPSRSSPSLMSISVSRLKAERFLRQGGHREKKTLGREHLSFQPMGDKDTGVAVPSAGGRASQAGLTLASPSVPGACLYPRVPRLPSGWHLPVLKPRKWNNWYLD